MALSSPQAQAPTAASDAPRLSELIESHLRAKDDIKPRTLAKYRAIFATLIEVMGDPPVSDATFNHDTLGKARETIRRLPPNRSKGDKAGKTVDELLSMGLDPMSDNTFRDHMTRLAEFSKWAVRHRYLSFNPMEGALPRRKKGTRARKERDAFTDEQLQILFNPETFTTRQHKNAHYKPSHYWVPLLGLMTGARLAELTGLSLRDIEQDSNGNWLIQIRENETGRTVKTEAGERAVPILQPLLDLGFLEYAEEIKARGYNRLFPDVHPLNGTDWSHQFSKWFGRHRERIGLGKGTGPADDGAVSFHSLRHTVITRLTLARIQAHELKALVGHEQDGVTFNRYFKGFPPELLSQFLASLSFPIDWQELKDKWKPAMRQIDRRGHTANT